MAGRRKVSEPEIPDAQKCPRCGHHILIGDTICPNCGYSVQPAFDRIKSQPPMVVSGTLFVLGIAVAVAATGMDKPWQFIALVIGFGLIAAGGLYYAADILIWSADDRRHKPGDRR